MATKPMEIVFDNQQLGPQGMPRDEVKRLIVAAIPDADVTLYDLTGGGNHYQAEVVSAAFAGKTPLQRQRMVNEALREPLSSGTLHALALTCRPPAA